MTLDQQGRTWLKGNLHTHTTNSDGKFSPAEAEELYRSRGYDFLALTDHWKCSETEEKDGFLLISGCEYNFNERVQDGVFHIVGFGMERNPGVEKSDSPQLCIDKIHRAGGLAQLAHPAWSLNTPEQILSLHGLDATEIYNSVSGLPRNCRPYSGAVLDMIAAQGHFLPLLATDDTHFYMEADSCRSYIMVQAEERTKEAIFAAIRNGAFYATQGPELHMEREGRTLRVRTSPVESIVCYTDAAWDPHRAEVGENITEAEFTLSPIVTFARIEATDAQGNCAWSSYIDFRV